MKRFNQEINISISVDSIAQKMLENMDQSFKHKENVVEAVIGSMLDSGNIHYVFNALNGYTNDIDFKVGDYVYCQPDAPTHRVKCYFDTYIINDAVHDKPVFDMYLPAKVLEVNPYRREKIRLEIRTVVKLSTGKYKINVEDYWFDHKDMNKISENMDDTLYEKFCNELVYAVEQQNSL